MAKIQRYVIVTPFAKAEVLAGIAALHHLDVDVVPSKSGALIVRNTPAPEYDEWDIRNITGPSADDPEEPREPSDDGPGVAQTVSRLSAYGAVLVTVDMSDDAGFEEGVSGLVHAYRYLDGVEGEEIPGGLLLNALDPLVERLVLGEKTPKETGGISVKEIDADEIAAFIHDDPNGDHSDSPEKPRPRGLFGRRKKNKEES